MDAVIRADLDTVAEMCTPDCEFSNPDGVFRGREEVRALFKNITDALSERYVQVTSVLESGNTVIAEFIYGGNNTRPLVLPQLSLPPTNKPVRSTALGIYELRDGKVVVSRGYYDRLEIMAQLGLAQAPAPA
jgi:ketosteroid isomerase-like protein